LDNDRDIFLALLESHKGIIYRVANLYCRDPQDRQDVIQEIIVQLWTSFGKYDSTYKHSTWVYRIALNTAISFYRKTKVQKESSVYLSPILESTISGGEPFQEDPNILLLKRFIDQLDEIDKSLILLFLDGHKYKEIAMITGFTLTKMSTRIARIKKALKKKFQHTKS